MAELGKPLRLFPHLQNEDIITGLQTCGEKETTQHANSPHCQGGCFRKEQLFLRDGYSRFSGLQRDIASLFKRDCKSIRFRVRHLVSEPILPLILSVSALQSQVSTAK